MAIKTVGPGAYFVVDAFSYRSQIQEYDPHVTSQTLISFGDEPQGGLVVLEEGLSEFPNTPDEFLRVPIGADEFDEQEGGEEPEARAELKRITPPNAELLRLAKQFPAPQEWYDE